MAAVDPEMVKHVCECVIRLPVADEEFYHSILKLNASVVVPAAAIVFWDAWSRWKERKGQSKNQR